MTAATDRTSRRLAIWLAVAAVIGLGVFAATRMLVPHAKSAETAAAAKTEQARYVPSAAEWASLTVEPATEESVRAAIARMSELNFFIEPPLAMPMELAL